MTKNKYISIVLMGMTFTILHAIYLYTAKETDILIEQSSELSSVQHDQKYYSEKALQVKYPLRSYCTTITSNQNSKQTVEKELCEEIKNQGNNSRSLWLKEHDETQLPAAHANDQRVAKLQKHIQDRIS
ncbi:hypothetical protein [Plesiomonas sp.]|uniref:hypothetical protein n=1 Tax=Plesiomonas sp. TaxID=2486279 RepID=UPI003F2B2959